MNYLCLKIKFKYGNFITINRKCNAPTITANGSFYIVEWYNHKKYFKRMKTRFNIRTVIKFYGSIDLEEISYE